MRLVGVLLSETLKILPPHFSGSPYITLCILSAYYGTCNTLILVKVPGIYGSKQTEWEGVAQRRGLLTTAINPWPPAHLIGPLLLLL